MENSNFQNLINLVEECSLVILRLSESDFERISDTRNGESEFSVVESHYCFEQVRVPTLCLIFTKKFSQDTAYLSIITSIQAVATLESRMKLKRCSTIYPSNEDSLIQLIDNQRHKTNLQQRLDSEDKVIRLSPKLSAYLLNKLSENKQNHSALERLVAFIDRPTRFSNKKALQRDAINSALKIFGIEPDTQSSRLELVEGKETALTGINILEDRVIEHDARNMPNSNLIESDVTGRAVFEHAGQRLEVFTANKTPLEEVLGVDLIYFNLTRQNVVMLQYKMLDRQRNGSDWIYRPDRQMDTELDRMARMNLNPPEENTEYRLNNDVFYLKFVKRDQSLSSNSIIIPVEHFQTLRINPDAIGPRGGFRISFHSLDGRYLRQGTFFDLIRSGYIGANSTTTEHYRNLVQTIIEHGRAVITAIQSDQN